MDKQTKISPIKLKSVDETAGIVTAYASVFGVVDLDGEVVDKGAFSESLQQTKGKIPVLWQHDRRQPIGWGLTAKEDETGLLVQFQVLLDSEQGRTAFSFIKTGLDVGANVGMSIGFTVPANGSYLPPGGSVRHFSRVGLAEYSVVTFPACPQA